MSNETGTRVGKPSEDIAARAAALVAQYRADGIKGYNARGELKERAVVLLGGPAEPAYALTLLALAEHLDAEAERRAAWEARVEAFARAQGVEL